MCSKAHERNLKEWQYFKVKLYVFYIVYRPGTIILTLCRNFEDVTLEKETILDLMTWKRWTSNALRRSHGVFGEGIEYFFLKQEGNLAFLKVNYRDKDTFSSAVSSYISSDELVGCPLFVTILQETSNLQSLEVTQDDEIWLRRAIESDDEEFSS